MPTLIKVSMMTIKVEIKCYCQYVMPYVVKISNITCLTARPVNHPSCNCSITYSMCIVCCLCKAAHRSLWPICQAQVGISTSVIISFRCFANVCSTTCAKICNPHKQTLWAGTQITHVQVPQLNHHSEFTDPL